MCFGTGVEVAGIRWRQAGVSVALGVSSGLTADSTSTSAGYAGGGGGVTGDCDKLVVHETGANGTRYPTEVRLL